MSIQIQQKLKLGLIWYFILNIFIKIAIYKIVINNQMANKNLPGVYIVESIEDFKTINKKQYYYIKWKDYSSMDNTWEPIENLLGLEEMIEDFKKSKIKSILKNQNKTKQKTKSTKLSCKSD